MSDSLRYIIIDSNINFVTYKEGNINYSKDDYSFFSLELAKKIIDFSKQLDTLNETSDIKHCFHVLEYSNDLMFYINSYNKTESTEEKKKFRDLILNYEITI